jgi:hypothetical protein
MQKRFCLKTGAPKRKQSAGFLTEDEEVLTADCAEK